MADKDKGQVISTRDLYVRSNPGLLGTGQDVTNPREWYNSSAANSLLNALSDKGAVKGRKTKAKTGEPGPAMTFYVNFPNLSSSAIGYGQLQNGDVADTNRAQTERPSDSLTQDEKQLPQIKQKEGWKQAHREVHKKNIALDEFEENKENEVRNDNESVENYDGDVSVTESQVLPPLGDASEISFAAPNRRKEKDHVFSLPKLANHELILPPTKLSRSSVACSQLMSHLYRTLPEETLRHAQIRAGYVKGERKAITTQNSRDPESFKDYTEKYMELRLPRSQEKERTLRENMHRTYNMRQKSLLKLKLGYDEEGRSKKMQRQRLDYDTGSSMKARLDYSNVKSKLGQYIHQEQPAGKVQAKHASKEGRRGHAFASSGSGTTVPRFSLGPQSNPVTPLDKYNADNFPLVMDEDGNPAGRENTEAASSVKSSSTVKLVPGKSAKRSPALQKEHTKASVVTLALCTPAVSTEDVRGESLEARPVYDTTWASQPAHEGRSILKKTRSQSDSDKSSSRNTQGEAMANAHAVSLGRFKKLEIFGERQSRPNEPQIKAGETIESIRGSVDFYPPYILDKTATSEIDMETSAQVFESPNRRVSTITVGTDISDTVTPRGGDGFPKSRSVPHSTSNLRYKSNSMATLVEKSFIADGEHVALPGNKMYTTQDGNHGKDKQQTVADQSKRSNQNEAMPSNGPATSGDCGPTASVSFNTAYEDNEYRDSEDLTKSLPPNQ